jgi:hypothetical protein
MTGAATGRRWRNKASGGQSLFGDDGITELALVLCFGEHDFGSNEAI